MLHQISRGCPLYIKHFVRNGGCAQQLNRFSLSSCQEKQNEYTYTAKRSMWRTDNVSKTYIYINIYIRFHLSIILSSVQLLSCVQLFETPWTEHTRLPCPSPTPGACSNSWPLSQWCHPTISSSPPAFNPSQHQCISQWVSSLHLSF